MWAINGLLLLVILPAAISAVTAAKERAAKLRYRRRRKEDAEDLAVLAYVTQWSCACVMHAGGLVTCDATCVSDALSSVQRGTRARLLNHRREARGERRVTGAQLWDIVNHVEGRNADANS